MIPAKAQRREVRRNEKDILNFALWRLCRNGSKPHTCHSERSEESRPINRFQRRDPSAAPQDDIATQSVGGINGLAVVCVNILRTRLSLKLVLTTGGDLW